MKKTLAKFLLVFFFSVPVLAASTQNFIVAKINNKALTSLELLDRYRFIILSSKIRIDSPSDRKLLLEQILDKMIDEELIRQEAAGLKLETNAEEINNAIEVFALRQKKNEAQFKLFLLKTASLSKIFPSKLSRKFYGQNSSPRLCALRLKSLIRK